jgi:hypothetical protein
MHTVICYWAYEEKWVLKESFQMDEDGHCIQIPSTGGNSRHEYHKWMNKPLDEDEWDFEPIMGRAVTVWDMDHGVGLLDIHPPEWVDWLSVSFYEKLCKMPDWYVLLNEGWHMFMGTAKEVEKYVTGVKGDAKQS